MEAARPQRAQGKAVLMRLRWPGCCGIRVAASAALAGLSVTQSKALRGSEGYTTFLAPDNEEKDKDSGVMRPEDPDTGGRGAGMQDCGSLEGDIACRPHAPGSACWDGLCSSGVISAG